MSDQKEETQIVRKPIEIDQYGNPIPTTLEDQFRIANLYRNSGMLPSQYDSPEKVIVGMQYARELGFKGKMLTAMRQISVIHGTPTLWGDLPLALVLNANVLQEFNEYFVDENGKKICIENSNIKEAVFGAVCELKRNGQKYESFFTLDDAERAGLYPAIKRNGEPNPDSPWMKYTKRMLKYRARSQGLKDVAPDALMGMAIAEYDFNVIPDGKQIIQKSPENAKNVAQIVDQAIQEKETGEEQTNIE